jgi:hypothetical protein
MGGNCGGKVPKPKAKRLKEDEKRNSTTLGGGGGSGGSRW